MVDTKKLIVALEDARDLIDGWIPTFEQHNTPAAIDFAIELLKEREKKIGRWLPHAPSVPWAYECSECQHAVYEKYKYCPNCGSKMDFEATNRYQKE